METSSLRKAVIMEINLISAQELMSSTSKPSSKPMQTYGVAFIDPKEKAVSRVDRTGDTNPTWNDKFVFSVDEEFERRRPNSCLVLEIYRVRRFRKDEKIGVVHVLLEDLLKINGKNCMAFLVRNTWQASWNHQCGSSNLERHVNFMKKCPSFFLQKLQWTTESWWAVARRVSASCFQELP